jgi:hypothetical protein
MTAGITLAAIALMAFAVLTLVCVVLARLSGYRARGAKGSALSSGFSMSRYEPLTRLLADGDLGFLRQQCSCPEIAERWNQARRRIIRLYLKDLAADFRRLHADARALVAESPEQNSELVNVLMKQQLIFWREMARVELSLTANWLGLGTVSPGRLVESIAALQVEITRTIRPVPAQA